jgi:hypothetical protein
MKTKEEIYNILDEIDGKIVYYNENIAKDLCFLANSIILPNELYFEFTDKNFIQIYSISGIFPVCIKEGVLRIFGMKCYRTSKSDKISVEFKFNN